MTALSIEELCKYFPTTHTHALQGLTLQVTGGDHLAIVGPSGCGKSTLLKIIAGLVAADRGVVRYNKQIMNNVAPHRREAVMVFQDHLLFPFMNVAENIAFGLRMQRVAPSERRRRVEEMLDLVQLPGFGMRQPHELSGGQQQRVALARALVVQPRLLLLDEPLANLDVHLRRQMVHLIVEIQQRLKLTTLTVTHNQAEAFAMGNRVALMFEGAIEQIGDGQELSCAPISARAAQFFGNWNQIAGNKRGRIIESQIGAFELPSASRYLSQPDGKVRLFIRPEALSITSRTRTANTLTATITRLFYGGSRWHYRLLVGGELWEMASETAHNGPTNQITLKVQPEALLVFAVQHQ